VWSAQTDKLLYTVASLRKGFLLVATQNPNELRPVQALAQRELPAIELAALLPESIAGDKQASVASLGVILQRVRHVADLTLNLRAEQILLQFFTSFIRKSKKIESIGGERSLSFLNPSIGGDNKYRESRRLSPQSD
jgi:hypothetical protein